MGGDNSAEERRALAALILAESGRNGAGHGTRLPTERQLALDLGVSRSAVRHAMAVLQAEGRVSREVGRGTFLRDRGPEPVSGDGPGPEGGALADGASADGASADGASTDGAAAVDSAEGAAADGLTGPADYSPADVMAVRRLFEPTAMSLVVAWATARDFAEMDRCLRGGERSADHDEFEVWDAALHRSIIAATRSPLLVRLYSEVERARHGRMWGDLKRRSATAARRDEYRRDHEEIVTALRLRDADRATTAMRTHLARVSRHLLGTGLSGSAGLGGQAAEEGRVPEPELVCLEAVVVLAKVSCEKGEVVADPGVAIGGDKPAARRLLGLSELGPQGGHRVHRVSEEQESPEDGQRDAGEEQVGSRPFHPVIIS